MLLRLAFKAANVKASLGIFPQQCCLANTCPVKLKVIDADDLLDGVDKISKRVVIKYTLDLCIVST